MPDVRLHGYLVCSDEQDVVAVLEHLDAHIELTRAEAGCISFDVSRTDDPFVWRVEERFTDTVAFRRHQDRVAASDWGRATAGIERRYTIEGVESGRL